MKNSFELVQTSLSRISHTKTRLTMENDPTKSSMPKRSLYVKPHKDKEGIIHLGLHERRYWLFDSKNDTFLFEKPKENWIYFNDGRQRVDVQSVLSRFNRVILSAQSSWKEIIQSELEKIASPFDLSQRDSKYLGLFFDGTDNFRGQSETSIYELYNLYAGNKIYYGGVGNSIENNFSRLKSAVAYGFDQNLERAMVDIIEFHDKANGSHRIQLFGFSRGAAQANELAKNLSRHKFEVDVLLMVDPVYSVGVAGQGSARVRLSEEGKKGNFVEASISDNVRKAVVLYAEHETRVLFPATKFNLDDGTKTELIAGLTPGNHCDAGGFWNRNGAFQYVSLYWILENISSGTPGDPFSGNLDDLQWQNAIGTRLREITTNRQSTWNWSNIDWFYILSKNLLSLPKKAIKNLAKKYLGPTFGEDIGERVAHRLFGDQQEESEIERNFDTFGYVLEKFRDWLEEKNALPITGYDYVSKPLPVSGSVQA
jgi:hypothetical protein